ncbi:hypothetical protein [Streptomyces sp. NPDC057494]|uniref:hypothetical protein n=1 Tax=Streptomyces sp. NPDC057494 TaxID=3346148 RepID=UPI0036851EB2
MEADAASFAAVAEAGCPQDAVLRVVALLAGEEKLGPVVDDVGLAEEPKGEPVFLWTHLDDAQGVLGETADLAAGEKDCGLQLCLLRATGRGDGERLVGVRKECVECLVRLAGATPAVFGEGQGGLSHRGRCSAPNRPPAASALVRLTQPVSCRW